VKRERERERGREGDDYGEASAMESAEADEASASEKRICEGYTVASHSEDSRCPAARLFASCRKRSSPALSLRACALPARRHPARLHLPPATPLRRPPSPSPRSLPHFASRSLYLALPRFPDPSSRSKARECVPCLCLFRVKWEGWCSLVVLCEQVQFHGE